MHRLVGKIEEERLIAVGLFLEPLHRVTCEQGHNVTALIDALPVHVDGVIGGRWEILSLSFEAIPIVEARPRIVTLAPHVPLADEAGIVSGFLQILGEKHGASGNRALVIDDAMAERVEPHHVGYVTFLLVWTAIPAGIESQILAGLRDRLVVAAPLPKARMGDSVGEEGFSIRADQPGAAVDLGQLDRGGLLSQRRERRSDEKGERPNNDVIHGCKRSAVFHSIRGSVAGTRAVLLRYGAVRLG